MLLNMLQRKRVAGLKSETKALWEPHICKCELVRPECLDVCTTPVTDSV